MGLAIDAFTRSSSPVFECPAGAPGGRGGDREQRPG
jgi:hypothetical protein